MSGRRLHSHPHGSLCSRPRPTCLLLLLLLPHKLTHFTSPQGTHTVRAPHVLLLHTRRVHIPPPLSLLPPTHTHTRTSAPLPQLAIAPSRAAALRRARLAQPCLALTRPTALLAVSLVRSVSPCRDSAVTALPCSHSLAARALPLLAPGPRPRGRTTRAAWRPAQLQPDSVVPSVVSSPTSADGWGRVQLRCVATADTTPAEGKSGNAGGARALQDVSVHGNGIEGYPTWNMWCLLPGLHCGSSLCEGERGLSPLWLACTLSVVVISLRRPRPGR